MNVKNRIQLARKLVNRKAAALLGAASAAVATLPAHADVIDVGEVVSGIKEYTGAGSPIVQIGGAILLVVLAVAAFKWVRSAMK